MSETKRQKTSNKSRILNPAPITKFDELPNELILICFDFLTFYHIYDSFYCLNQRFRQLLQYHAKIYINFDSIPNGKFFTFFVHLNQMIATSANYPISINASNGAKCTLILNDDFFKDNFCKLECLAVTDIEATTLSFAIFNEETKLYQRLERLSLLGKLQGDDDEIDRLCDNLVPSKMKSLKYLNVNLEPYSCRYNYGLSTRKDYVDLQFSYFSGNERSSSPLETLIFGRISDADVDMNDSYASTTRISFFNMVVYLLPHLPKLKNLMINSIHFEEDEHDGRLTVPAASYTNFNLSPNLKLIKIWTNVGETSPEVAEEKIKILREFFINNHPSPTTTLEIFCINNKNILENKL